MTTTRSRLFTVLVLAGALTLAVGCSSDGDDASGTSTTAVPTTSSTSTTVSGPAATSTTAGGATTTSGPVNTLPALIPGQPCSEGSDPDCIDPEGTGDYVYLIGGADCMASPIGGPSCTDLDGDGYAGYPDRG